MSVSVIISILQLLAGIGMFLFAMNLQEEALKNLSGRRFKLFLQRITSNRFGAVAGGAIITGILQSSSIVALMVLAFVGAGIFSMRNAIGIILGANLGSTFYSWLVAVVGFKMDLDVIAYPAIFIGGLMVVISAGRKTARYISYFLLGFGLLFIGLSFMKVAMETQKIDFTAYASLPTVVFLVIGFLITLIVQSSSVTMALTLSALFTGSITFPMAAALVLGSESGTTIKILVGSIGGNAAKKRVALGNLLFNIFLTVFAFIFLGNLLQFITEILGIKDPLIALVAFSTLINVLGIIVFLPLLDPYARMLERVFKNTDGVLAEYISHANINEPNTALDLFRREVDCFIRSSMLFNLAVFETEADLSDLKLMNGAPQQQKISKAQSVEEKYRLLKQYQGELQAFYLKLRIKLEGVQYTQLNQLIASVRSAMYSVKSMNDVSSNIGNLRRSSKDIKFGFFLHHQKAITSFYRHLYNILQQNETVTVAAIQELRKSVLLNYNNALNDFYKEAQETGLEDLDITTTINFNRELFTSNKAILMAIKDLVLDEQEAQHFNEANGYAD